MPKIETKNLTTKELKSLLGRCIGALENPIDLAPGELDHLIEDVQDAINEIED